MTILAGDDGSASILLPQALDVDVDRLRVTDVVAPPDTVE
jgi:hypothetical protein